MQVSHLHSLKNKKYYVHTISGILVLIWSKKFVRKQNLVVAMQFKLFELVHFSQIRYFGEVINFYVQMQVNHLHSLKNKKYFLYAISCILVLIRSMEFVRKRNLVVVV